MQIVIELADPTIEFIKKTSFVEHEHTLFKQSKSDREKTAMIFDVLDAIRNGTPLPKGHKIIDEYALQEHLALVPMEDRTYREAVEIIDWFPSIIEAYKGE